MGKKKKKAVPVQQPKQEKAMTIDMNEINLKKQHLVPAFRTGKHMTEKDRPRKKNWKREYERDKGSGKYGKYGPDFLLAVSCVIPAFVRAGTVISTKTPGHNE